MSFDVFLQYAQREAPTHAGLDAAIEGVVRAFGGGPGDAFGHCFKLTDGGDIELLFKRGDDNAMLALRSLTPGSVRFIGELMKATGWVVLIESEDACAAGLSPIAVADVQDDFPQITVVSADAELAAFLERGFEAWAEYRDEISGSNK